MKAGYSVLGQARAVVLQLLSEHMKSNGHMAAQHLPPVAPSMDIVVHWYVESLIFGIFVKPIDNVGRMGLWDLS